MGEHTRDLHAEIAERLISASRVCVSTGSGISAESGVPTFREADGLWNKFRPEELANVDAFLANPERVLEWYEWRRDLIRKVEPNPGHYALAELERRLEDFVLITQNIDNLHWDAGNTDVIELHGNILRNRCQECGRVYDTNDPNGDITFVEGTLPRCSCGKKGLLRPDVVWFGEILPEAALARAFDASEHCDMFLSVGTSTVVYPAAALPFYAKQNGAVLVEINPNPTDLTPLADFVLAEPSGVALPKIVERVQDLAG